MVLVRPHVVLPEGALLGVGGRELPVLLGVVDPLEEPPLLLLARDVQEELPDDDPVVAEVALVAPDVPVTVLPDVLRHELRGELGVSEEFGVHLHDEHVLVVGAVEDADASALGQLLVAAPEEVVVELLARRDLEGRHLAALRIDAGHHVLDRSVLPGRVHRLEDEEDRPAVLRVEPVLQLREGPDPVWSASFAWGFASEPRPAGVAGVDVLQPELFGPCRRDRARRTCEPA